MKLVAVSGIVGLDCVIWNNFVSFFTLHYTFFFQLYRPITGFCLDYLLIKNVKFTFCFILLLLKFLMFSKFRMGFCLIMSLSKNFFSLLRLSVA